MESITLNGKEYLLKDDIDKSNSDSGNSGIMDISNVGMLVNVPDSGDVIEFKKPALCFKRLCEFDDDEKVLFGQDRFFIYFEKERNTYSLDFKHYFDMILSGMGCRRGLKKYTPSVFLSFNKETNTFKKDYPCLLVSGNYGYILAPRVISE